MGYSKHNIGLWYKQVTSIFGFWSMQILLKRLHRPLLLKNNASECNLGWKYSFQEKKLSRLSMTWKLEVGTRRTAAIIWQFGLKFRTIYICMMYVCSLLVSQCLYPIHSNFPTFSFSNKFDNWQRSLIFPIRKLDNHGPSKTWQPWTLTQALHSTELIARHMVQCMICVWHWECKTKQRFEWQALSNETARGLPYKWFCPPIEQ